MFNLGNGLRFVKRSDIPFRGGKTTKVGPPGRVRPVKGRDAPTDHPVATPKERLDPGARARSAPPFPFLRPTLVLHGKIGSSGKRCKPLFLLVPRGGIEPPTRGFSVLCSTD